MASGSVVASMVGAGVVSAAKFTAAAFSGSSAMFAEGVRSAANCGNSALLALGQRRSKQAPDALHPFGYGKELCFWALVVATVLLAVAGAGTVAKGVMRVLDPQELKNTGWNYAVLGLAALLAGYGWWKAFKEFHAGQGNRTLREGGQKGQGPDHRYGPVRQFREPHRSGDCVPRAAPVAAPERTRDRRGASVLIGLMMATVAGYLVYQSKQLLVGESAVAGLKDAMRDAIERDDAVRSVKERFTMHLGPEDVLVIAASRSNRTFPARPSDWPSVG